LRSRALACAIREDVPGLTDYDGPSHAGNKLLQDATKLAEVEKDMETSSVDARKTSSDNFIDKAFTVMADLVVANMPLSQQEKDAYQYYRDGMAAQTSGDYSTALRAYAESLKLEEDPIDRSYIFYNLGLIFGNNGEYIKAVKYYHLAIDQNKQICQAYNNIAVIYHDQGTRAERSGNIEKANLLYDKAAQYWNQAIKIAPTNYLEAYNWLKSTGRLATALDNKIMGIF